LGPAEFETNLRRKRQLEGIAKAKAARLQGPASLDPPGQIAGRHVNALCVF
jgi:DNA invertase Pin-like site-specific DNA recombinase